MGVVIPGPDETVLVVVVGGALERYFCFISSAVNGAPVLRIPEPVELSEPVLESDDALLAAGVCTSEDVLLLRISKQLERPVTIDSGLNLSRKTRARDRDSPSHFRQISLKRK